MNKCSCGSHAINPGYDGRLPGVMLDKCNVCYWRITAEKLQAEVASMKALGGNLVVEFVSKDGK